MVGPEAGVYQADVAHLHVVAVADIYQTRAQGFEIGAFGVDLAAEPELIPEAPAVAVDGAGAGDGEAVYAVGIDEGCEVVDCLSFEARLDYFIMSDGVAAFEASALGDVEVCAGFEEERAAQIYALGNGDYAAPVFGCEVDDFLYGLGLDKGGVTLDNAVVGDNVALAEVVGVDRSGVAEPLVDRSAVGP